MNLTPDDPLLTSGYAPHETAAVLRMHRNGTPGFAIAETLEMKGTELVKALQSALDAEGEASRRGVPIHDARAKRDS
ncbi:hypothetical protein [Nocardia terpenica]|uniref:Gp68-like predicted RNA polymerase component domain-containing protein n=1 Tax=Nocardia terpenica TaxID=455432 RepID=A0A164IFB6_9NOCA|nr:hypothetical protein [Nocardia terpenica]KZM69392.1 hypothetical protein AWN90_13820 [Nocardia terpenica]NQE88094.1 hypothetical protein [Nocardia terpenica]